MCWLFVCVIGKDVMCAHIPSVPDGPGMATGQCPAADRCAATPVHKQTYLPLRDMFVEV